MCRIEHLLRHPVCWILILLSGLRGPCLPAFGFQAFAPYFHRLLTSLASTSRAFLWVEVLGGDLRLSRHSCSGSFASLLLAMRPQASLQPPNFAGVRRRPPLIRTDPLPSMAEWLKYTHRFPGLEASRRKQWAAWEGLGQEPVREMFSIAWRRRVLGKMNASCTLHGLVLRSFCTPHAHTFKYVSH